MCILLFVILFFFQDLLKRLNESIVAITKRTKDYVSPTATCPGGASSIPVIKALLEMESQAIEVVAPEAVTTFEAPLIISGVGQALLIGEQFIKFVDSWQKQFKRDMLDKGRAGRRMLEVEGSVLTELSAAISSKVLARLEDFSGFVGDRAGSYYECPSA